MSYIGVMAASQNVKDTTIFQNSTVGPYQSPSELPVAEIRRNKTCFDADWNPLLVSRINR